MTSQPVLFFLWIVVIFLFTSCRYPEKENLNSYYTYSQAKEKWNDGSPFTRSYSDYPSYHDELVILAENNPEYLVYLGISFCVQDNVEELQRTIQKIQDIQGITEEHFNAWPSNCSVLIPKLPAYDNGSDLDKELISSIEEIRNSDQKYRSIDPIDWSMQTPIDKNNLKQFEEIIESYIEDYQELQSFMGHRFINPSIIFGHSSYEETSFIEDKILEACENNLVNWETMENICNQRQFKFPKYIVDSVKFFEFKYLVVDDNKLDKSLSSLELNSLSKHLLNNPWRRINIYHRDENGKKVASDILSYLISKGIEKRGVKLSPNKNLQGLDYAYSYW